MTEQNNENGLVVYGAMWCSDCVRTKRYLDQNGIAYTWLDVENDPTAQEAMMKINGGVQSIPTLRLPDGQVLIEPSNRDLADALARATSR